MSAAFAHFNIIKSTVTDLSIYMKITFVISSIITHSKAFTIDPIPVVIFVKVSIDRLALVIHCDSHLSSITLSWQLLSVIKVVLVYQILLT